MKHEDDIFEAALQLVKDEMEPVDNNQAESPEATIPRGIGREIQVAIQKAMKHRTIGLVTQLQYEEEQLFQLFLQQRKNDQKPRKRESRCSC